MSAVLTLSVFCSLRAGGNKSPLGSAGRPDHRQRCRVGKQPVAIMPNNSVYRVGDLWYDKGDRANKLRNLAHRKSIRDESMYRGSIMQCYLSQREWWQHDASSLRRCCAILQQPSLSAAGSAVVIHLRVGDKDTRYMLDRMEAHIAHFNMTRIVLVTAINFSPFREKRRYLFSASKVGKACRKIQETSQFFQRRGYRVAVRSSTDIDADLCFMAGSHHFVPSYGGLSQLAECLSSGAASCPKNRSIAQSFACKNRDGARRKLACI